MSTNSKEDKVSMHCTSHWSFEFIKRIRWYTKEELFKTQEAHSIRNAGGGNWMKIEKKVTFWCTVNCPQRVQRDIRRTNNDEDDDDDDNDNDNDNDNENKWFDYMVTAQEQETECKRGKVQGLSSPLAADACLLIANPTFRDVPKGLPGRLAAGRDMLQMCIEDPFQKNENSQKGGLNWRDLHTTNKSYVLK
ncbi:predicted protein [Histoplasma capsulatum var. duboisii H88]|uniref:Predicted protein n=1 Tax=Ajellomyces capsulatus (strain H88) TaxID=544711 RepID=F0UW38_AJEC8|nr:predicted protein [Histoplasma capsulatum var. duboisii H88]